MCANQDSKTVFKKVPDSLIEITANVISDLRDSIKSLSNRIDNYYDKYMTENANPEIKAQYKSYIENLENNKINLEKRLEEERKRLEEERKRLQEERKRLEEEERKRLDEERKRLEEERKRLEEEERKRLEEERKRLEEERKLGQNDISMILIDSLKQSVNNLTKNGQNIDTDNLLVIFDKQTHEIFGRKIPIQKNNNINSLDQILQSDIEIKYDSNHCFRTIYEDIIYKDIDYSECKTEAQYAYMLNRIVFETFIQYFKISKQQVFKVHLDKSYSQIAEFSSHSKSNNKMFYKNPKNESKNLSQMRPDLCISDAHGRVILKAEFKQNSDFLSLAKKEIINKCFVTNKELYSNNNFGTFAFVAAGFNFQLFYLDRKYHVCDSSNLILSCNLNILQQRVKLIKDMMCLCNLIELTSIKNPTNIYYDFFETIVNEEKTRIIKYGLNNTVIKQVKIDWIQQSCDFETYFNKLKNFYQILSEGKIKNSIKFNYMYKTDNFLHIITEPICESNIQGRIKTLTDFKHLFTNVLESVQSLHLHKIAHCDIRWPNIVYDCINSKYLLIDFENIEQLCESKCKIVSENHECIKPENDFKMIALLIDKLTNVFTDEKDKQFIGQLKNLLLSKKTINPILNFLK